jgi:carbohydrate-selective porin OprB
MLPSRPLDTLGLGVSETRLVDGNRETSLVSLELFYCVQLFPRLRVQPDIRCFYKAADHQKNGLAAGCRWLVKF